MNILKSFSRGFFALLFKFSALLFIVVTPIVLVFGTSAELKTSLKKSGVYDHAVDIVIDSAKKDTDQSNREDNPLNNPAVQNSFKKALSPAFLQTSAEQIIDGGYNFLDGKTAKIQFKIDASSAKQAFIDATVDYAVTRANGLPTCSVAQLKEMAGQKIDPLEIGCKPPIYTAELIRAQVTEQLDKNGGDFLKNPIITPETLSKDDGGSSKIDQLSEKGKKAQKIFQVLKNAPLILGALALVSGGLLVLLHDDKRRGVRNLAVTLLPIGVLGLLGVFVTARLFAGLEKSDLVIKADASVQQPLLNVIHSLSSALNQKIVIISLLYTVLGVGTLLVLHFTKPKVLEAVPVADSSPEDSSAEPKTEPEKAEETK